MLKNGSAYVHYFHLNGNVNLPSSYTKDKTCFAFAILFHLSETLQCNLVNKRANSFGRIQKILIKVPKLVCADLCNVYF